MAITKELQRKFKYKVIISTPTNLLGYTDVRVDEFTPSMRKREAIKTQTPSGVKVLAGPISYDEFTLKIAVEIDTVPPQTAVLIQDLEGLLNSNDDSFDLTVMFINNIDGEDQESYRQVYESCRLLSVKYDDLNSKGDDDVVYWIVSGIPETIKKIEGKQMTAG
jgi:hypothetical protein